MLIKMKRVGGQGSITSLKSNMRKIVTTKIKLTNIAETMKVKQLTFILEIS